MPALNSSGRRSARQRERESVFCCSAASFREPGLLHLLDPTVGSDRLSVSTARLKCEIASASAGIARISPNALSTILIKHDTRALFLLDAHRWKFI